MSRLTEQERYYLRSIYGNLSALKALITDGPTLGGEVIADNMNFLDCLIDEDERATPAPGWNEAVEACAKVALEPLEWDARAWRDGLETRIQPFMWYGYAIGQHFATIEEVDSKFYLNFHNGRGAGNIGSNHGTFERAVTVANELLKIRVNNALTHPSPAEASRSEAVGVATLAPSQLYAIVEALPVTLSDECARALQQWHHAETNRTVRAMIDATLRAKTPT